MKQTAVEFILRELANHFEEEMQNLYSKNMQLVANICEQAKEMERQQIVDACHLDKRQYDNAEHYYNETFNK